MDRIKIRKQIHLKEKKLVARDANSRWKTSSERQDLVQEILDLKEKLQISN